MKFFRLLFVFLALFLVVNTVSAFCAPPTVNFNGTPLTGTAPLTVLFVDMSDPKPDIAINWTWDFDNDGIIDDTTQNATYIYTIAGTYSVHYGVTDSCDFGYDETKVDYITVLSGIGNITINSTIGASWIKWEWGAENDTKNIYVDGDLVIGNSKTLGYYELRGLNQNEEHVITIQDVSTSEEFTKTDKTLEYYWYLPLILIIGCIIIGTKIPMFNIVSLLTSFYGFYQIFSYTLQSWLYIVYGFTIIISIAMLRFKIR